jgi:ubiquinone biosynthesis protein
VHRWSLTLDHVHLIVATSIGGGLVRVVLAIAIAAAITAISLRLLGLRRGWPKALLAGVIGWGTAALLALGLAHWDWGEEGLAIHTAAIGIPATMAAAVTLDLLARPGTLATGERAGLVVIPRPFRAVRRRIDVLRRYRELLGLARREGFGPLVSAQGRTERSTEATGVRMRRLLEDAGGVYIKLGQIAATRVDLISPELAAELAQLQNRVKPEPVERIRPVLEGELGQSVDEVFAEFDWEPLAAASIGQTYRARLRTGEPVVVKVQRPGIDEVMERDLAALGLVANLVQRRTPFGQSTRSGEVLDQFARSLRAELDFRREADAMDEMRTLLGPDSVVRIPTVFKELCTRRLLVQEQFDGFTVADSDALAASPYDRSALADALLRSMLEQVLTIGFFHADPHPGNVFVLEGGALGLIDFGAVGRLDPIQQKAMVDLMAALVRRDVEQLRDGIERVAEMPETVPPERLERSFARLMADHLRPGGTVDPSILQDLISTLSEFGIRLPGDLVVLSRALVTLDGTLGIISPGVSLVAAATNQLTGADGPPIVDPQTIVRDELLSMLPHLRRLPDRLDRTLMLAGRGDLRVRSVVDEDSRRILRTLVNRGLLAVIGAVFLTVSTMLLVTDEEGPGVADSVGLYEIFGYGGLLAGTVLCLRVVAGVARDGTV